jgi:RNase P/RNase MRP subunit p30
MIIEENNFEKARKKIRESKDKKKTFTSSDDELNRKILEKEDIQTLLVKVAGRKDFSKQRNSGLDSVMSKIAKKKNISIGILLDEISNSQGKEKAQILGRVMQNVALCNKNKIQMEFIAINQKNQRNYHDLKALGLVLGMPTWMTKNL